MRAAVPAGVVITGLGAVSPLGIGVPAFTAGLRAGRSGIAPFDPGEARTRSRVAALCAQFRGADVVGAADAARLPRLVPMALAAAREALAQAGLAERPGAPGRGPGTKDAAPDPARIGLILGTGGGGIDFTLDQFARAGAGKSASLWTITNATHGNLAGELSIRLGLNGPSLCVSTGCASSSDAAGLGLTLLRARAGAFADSLDALVVIGADAHVRWETLHTMELLGVLSLRDWPAQGRPASAASRPFDAHRDGFVLGEGAWAAVLERPGAARARGAAPLARLAGYGATCDAYHRVRPAPDVRQAARAIRLALADAGFGPEQVAVAQYHGTSTRVNDGLETAAIRAAFGAHAPRLRGSSIKSMIGHPQGACGLAALVAMVAALGGRDGGGPFVPPTINLDDPDLAGGCDLDYTPHRAAELERPAARDGPVVALVNCLAFGAKNSALVVAVPG
ncbi:MAG TPA: beta-ketoacyl synthase N-terminal-like domain-containing protein [Phycisphaerales bacterium]|nr:beta-ketoacyl synthase N-terminal-like domain-containing protein [Phycisphaerales bacterium]